MQSCLACHQCELARNTAYCRHVSPEFHVCAEMEATWRDSASPQLQGKTNSTNLQSLHPADPESLSPISTPFQNRSLPQQETGHGFSGALEESQGCRGADQAGNLREAF